MLISRIVRANADMVIVQFDDQGFVERETISIPSYAHGKLTIAPASESEARNSFTVTKPTGPRGQDSITR